MRPETSARCGDARGGRRSQRASGAGDVPLVLAAAQGHDDVVRPCWTPGAIRMPTSAALPPMAAARSGHLAVVESLLDGAPTRTFHTRFRSLGSDAGRCQRPLCGGPGIAPPAAPIRIPWIPPACRRPSCRCRRQSRMLAALLEAGADPNARIGSQEMLPVYDTTAADEGRRRRPHGIGGILLQAGATCTHGTACGLRH